MKDLESLPRLYIRGMIGPNGGFGDMAGDSFSADDAAKFLEQHKDAPEIVVDISSDGGYKTEGVQIFRRMRASGKHITTIGFKANSIATVLFLSGDERLVVDDCQFVVHNARIDPLNLGLDPLTADDFQKLAAGTEKADQEIIDLYCSVLGEDKRTKLIAAMAVETDLGAQGAIDLGFATGYYKSDKEKATQNSFRGLITDQLAIIIQNKMADKTQETKLKELETLMLSGFKKIQKWIGAIKNEVTLPVQGGASIYIVPVNPELPDDLKGAKVFTVDAAGLPTTTPYADGEVPLEDGTGRVLVIAGGVVSEVREALDANKLKSENASLQAQLNDLKAQLTAVQAKADTDKAEAQKEVTAIQNAFTEYKKLIPGDKSDDKDKTDDITKMDFSKMNTAQRVRAMSKIQNKLETEKNK